MRKFLVTLTIATSILLAAGNSQARDNKLMVPIADLMAKGQTQDKLDPEIRLLFAGQSYPEPTRKYGNFVTNKKTNAFNKSDSEACDWVMLSALIALQDRARSEGGNAVVNIESYYKKVVMASATEYECHAGNVMAGVALRGDIVKLP
ncbi:excinuclease ATPase subunit [Granulosicoccus antarcticus]|uniref:Excinuclease ATPase subunit n=1 Tax=Granulosicoccus antarcticus IMCC3135 TaxID=1192854 RepID=A0A2Z2P028_9GAMM|nr:excinuclease ATPase subunit [Granulosicoccus antarcticus]ASJ76863.1 hypothetical protein IMCC3135_34115 [Granulosicoccus antarcticus IMCC3135]